MNKKEIQKEILLKAINSIQGMSDMAYQWSHKKAESFKRDKIHLHESNGMLKAVNQLKDMFNNI